MCGGTNLIDPFGVANAATKIAEQAPGGKALTGMQKKLAVIPGSPEALIEASKQKSFGDPYGGGRSAGDIAGGGTALSRNPRARDIGRTVGTIFALGTAAGAAGAGAEGAAGAGAEGATLGATEGATTLGASEAVAVAAPAAAPAAAAPAAAAPVGANAATGPIISKVGMSDALLAAISGMSLSDAAALASLGSTAASLAAGQPDIPSVASPTPPPPPPQASVPAGANPQRRRAVGDPTALTGPAGIPFENLILGRATVLGS